MRAVLTLLLSLAIFSSDEVLAKTMTGAQTEQAAVTQPKANASAEMAEFDSLRIAGSDALYNTDYKAARENYLRMTKVAPDHPAGYVYLANTLWLETLFASRRLSTTLYAGTSFYEQGSEDDKVDPKRDREFNDLIKQVLTVTKARLAKNPKDAESLYYQAAALGLRAGYETTVKRSFTRAIGDANDSIQIQRQVVKIDPQYVDAYMSIGLYEYVIDSLPFGWRLLARMAGLKGSKKKGIERLEMVTRQGKYTPDDARVLLIGIYTKEKQPERALELITELATRYPRNYLFGVERANMLYRMGRHEEGARAFSDLIKDNRIAQTSFDLINSQWGDALMAKGDYAGAIERYNEVKQWAKSEPGLVSMAHLRVGQSLDALGKRTEAMAEYQMVLKRENVYDSRKQAEQFLKKPFVPAKS